MQVDLFRLRRDLRQIQQATGRGKPIDERLKRWQARLDDSIARRAVRQRSVPEIEYPPELPISAKTAEIGRLIQQRQVVIVCGETGSGKSTQLPKICLEHGFGVKGIIGHTQPRRLAARSVASRVAEELSSSVGERVGFKIRFSDQTKPHTLVKLMTDGVLLAETRSDRFLDAYDVIIVDEAHERSLNIAFLLGYLRRILVKRPDLRLIITSATIDADRFAEHFTDESGPAPIQEISGRGYPVDIRYRPLEEDANNGQRDMFAGIVDAVRELSNEDPGDCLVFLPTERDIRIAAKKLRGDKIRGRDGRGLEILPLYARLSNAEQNKIFSPGKQQRIVLSTNVAESSLTVPRIRYVIDTGTVRISRYAPRSKVQRLPIEAISKASANQRAGRCGRIGPGICVRLYDREDFENRPDFTTPEIRRTNLAAVILQTQAHNLGAIDQFPFLDPPRPEAIRDGYRTLHEIAAVDDLRELTEIGHRLAKWPVDPRMGRMVLEADQAGCLSDVLIIAAALEIQDPRERPVEKQQAADQQHERFADEQSDFLSLLKLWDWFHGLKEQVSRSRLRKACVQHFVSYNRMLEWQDIHRQLLRLVQESGMKTYKRCNDYDNIHRSLMAGLLSGIAQLTGPHEYTGAGGLKFNIWPGSNLFSIEPKWIIAGEIVETSKRFGRTVARINPDWIEPLAGHLVKRNYSDPHWHEKSERCMAFERVTLFGIPIVQRRRVPYNDIDPGVCRQQLIEHGLVQRKLKTDAKFQWENEHLLDHIATLGDKARQRDYVLDDYTVFRFYNDRLPQEVIDGRALKQYVRKNKSEAAKRLTMTIEDLIDTETPISGDAFPDSLDVGGMQLPLEYRFEPGDEDDGVTAIVPQEGLHQAASERLSWLVPGMLEQRIVGLIKSLPKRLRRNLGTATDVAKDVATSVEFGAGDFHHVIAAALSQQAQTTISASDFRQDKLANHFMLNIRVVDEDGNEVARGRDADKLIRNAGIAQPNAEVAIDDAAWTRDGINSWDFDELPTQVQIQRGSIAVPGYPMLVDQGEAVSLRLGRSEETAEEASRLGLTRLYVIQERKEIRSQVRWLPEIDNLKILASGLLSADELQIQLIDLIARRAFVDDRPLPRTTEEFEARLQNRIEAIGVATQDVVKILPALIKAYHQVAIGVEELKGKVYSDAKKDIEAQLEELLGERFLTTTPWLWLKQFPRYLQGIVARIEKLSSIGKRDEDFAAEIQHYWQQYAGRYALDKASSIIDPELITYRWMIEEYRVSLYAQKLGTYLKVSPQRMEKQWDKVHK